MSLSGRPVHAGFALSCVIAIVLSGCGHHRTRANLPSPPARTGKTETGVASWYGIPYHGRRAASGEIFDMNAPTAAHRKLPFQTWVEVTNLSNGKRTDVRINDRGPFVRGRVIDLSQAAARDIGMLGAGTTRVRLKVISPPKEVAHSAAPAPETPAPAAASAANREEIPVVSTETTPTVEPTRGEEDATIPATGPATGPAAVLPAPGGFAVQAGAFSDPNRAESFRQAMEVIFMDARVVAGDRGLWRVIVGREMTREQANQLVQRVRKEVRDAVVVREPAAAEPTTPK